MAATESIGSPATEAERDPERAAARRVKVSPIAGSVTMEAVVGIAAGGIALAIWNLVSRFIPKRELPATSSSEASGGSNSRATAPRQP